MLRFVDSFDHYSDSELDLKWSNSNDEHLQTYAARHGSKGIFLNNGGGRWIEKVLDAQATWVIGFAAKWQSLGTGNPFVSFKDGSSTTHIDLVLDGSAHIVAKRSSTTLGTGTKVLSTGIWYFVEVKVTISDSAGVVIVKVDNVTDINLSSQDTRNGGNATADRIRFHPPDSGFYLDDVYMCDATGSSPTNDFLGDVAIECILPNANGTTSALDGSDGNTTDNYLLVDETSPNGDTDYVESADVGDKDTYNYPSIPETAGSIYGVQVVPYAKRSSSSSRSICAVARLSSTELDSADIALSTSYTYPTAIYETKPGGGAWSIANVNAAEFGVKVTA